MQQRFGFTKNSVRGVLLATIMPLGFFVALMAIPIIWLSAISTLTMPVSYAYLAIFYTIFAVLHLLFILLLLNKIRQRFSLGVILDDEGIWYEQTGKAKGLVPWSQISRMKEKTILRRCHLLDNQGNMLLKVDCFLQDFSQLSHLIAERIYTDIHPSRQTFAKTVNYRRLYAGLITLCVAVAIFEDWGGRLFALLMIAMLTLGYVTTVSKITLADKHFVLGFPWREKIIPFTEITDIKTTRFPGSGLLQIGIIVKGRRKPYRLTKLGIDDMQLLVILRQATGIREAKHG